MCDIAYVALAASIAGTAATYQAQKQQAEQASAIGDYNARLGEIQAKSAEDQGLVAQDEQRKKIRAIIGQQKAAMGASGVEGSSFNKIIDDTTVAGEEDLAMLRLNAAREAWGIRTGVSRDRWQAGAQASALRVQAAGTLLGGAANSFYTYKTVSARSTKWPS